MILYTHAPRHSPSLSVVPYGVQYRDNELLVFSSTVPFCKSAVVQPSRLARDRLHRPRSATRSLSTIAAQQTSISMLGNQLSSRGLVTLCDGGPPPPAKRLQFLLGPNLQASSLVPVCSSSQGTIEIEDAPTQLTRILWRNALPEACLLPTSPSPIRRTSILPPLGSNPPPEMVPGYIKQFG